ncbi:MAG: hypothetical protein ABI162_02170, partial [Luteolibacter sp.]
MLFARGGGLKSIGGSESSDRGNSRWSARGRDSPIDIRGRLFAWSPTLTTILPRMVICGFINESAVGSRFDLDCVQPAAALREPACWPRRLAAGCVA